MGHTLAVRWRLVPERARASGYLIRGHFVLQVNESRVQGIKGWRKEQMRGEGLNKTSVSNSTCPALRRGPAATEDNLVGEKPPWDKG